VVVAIIQDFGGEIRQGQADLGRDLDLPPDQLTLQPDDAVPLLAELAIRRLDLAIRHDPEQDCLQDALDRVADEVDRPGRPPFFEQGRCVIESFPGDQAEFRDRVGPQGHRLHFRVGRPGHLRMLPG